jgi:hypothetical protein
MDAKVTLLIGLLVFGVLPLVWAFANKAFRKTNPVMAAVVLGALVAGGWYVTGHMGFVPEHPETLEAAYIGTAANRPESLSYVAPYAQAVTLLTQWTDANSFVNFGVASMWGVVLGALLYNLSVRRVRVEIFKDNSDFFRHAIGALLMGFGGVTALGCTVGQGMTGMSTLSLGSLITLLAIIVGSAATVQWEIQRD